MEKLFENILDKDEKIEKVFKPQKAKFFFSVFLYWGITFLFFALVGVFAVLFPDEGMEVELVYLLIPIGIWIALMLLAFLFAWIYYKNIYFAYTNKRIIIRSGIFGVDFKSLDMSMIGAVNVYVSLIDKLVHKNTGSISFGSTASPIGYNQSSAAAYKFSHIANPYETYKEIKSFIDDYKKHMKDK